jgi:hypothetical protein
MKKIATKATSPVIVPVESKGLQKDYAMTPAQTRKALDKLGDLHARRKKQGKVRSIRGRFSPDYFV